MVLALTEVCIVSQHYYTENFTMWIRIFHFFEIERNSMCYGLKKIKFEKFSFTYPYYESAALTCTGDFSHHNELKTNEKSMLTNKLYDSEQIRFIGDEIYNAG